MSGIASATSTMPGNVATFWSCSSERSFEMASINSRSAKTLAGTRMSLRAAAGISHCVSLMRFSSILVSDIDHQVRLPVTLGLLEAQPVVCNRFDEMRRLAAIAQNHASDRVWTKLQINQPHRYEALRLDIENELGEELDEQGRPVRGLAGHLTLVGRFPCFLSNQLSEGRHRIAKDALLRIHLDSELELSRVFYPAIHGNLGSGTVKRFVPLSAGPLASRSLATFGGVGGPVAWDAGFGISGHRPPVAACDLLLPE